MLRHLVAYAELVAVDLQETQRDFKTRLMASLLLGICLFFLLMMVCLGVIAVTWDTPQRVPAIGWMGGTFLVIAVIAGLYRSKVIGASSPFLGTVKREWAEDRLILERILAERE